MAERKRLPTSPVLDEFPSEADGFKVSRAMAPYAFDSVIRSVHNAPRSRIDQLRTIVDAAKSRLRIRRGRAKPISEIPEGSDNLDIQSVNWWASQIEKDDRQAIGQLRVLDATLSIRTGG